MRTESRRLTNTTPRGARNSYSSLLLELVVWVSTLLQPILSFSLIQTGEFYITDLKRMSTSHTNPGTLKPICKLWTELTVSVRPSKSTSLGSSRRMLWRNVSLNERRKSSSWISLLSRRVEHSKMLKVSFQLYVSPDF